MGEKRGSSASRTIVGYVDNQGILAGVPFFDEVFAYAGCS
jgi:hypothetical protein